jgi:hypothetical protein
LLMSIATSGPVALLSITAICFSGSSYSSICFAVQALL